MSRLNLASVHVLFLALFLWGPAADAQLITGSVTGTVQDASGATIPGATIALTNTDTGNARTSQSNATGNFQFLQLESGNYSLRVQADGFAASLRPGIIVQTARSIAIPVTLEIGAVTETIEVADASPLLEANTSALGTVIDRQKLEDLPLAGRNYMNLANLVPTVRGIGYFGGPVLSTWRNAAVNIGGGSEIGQGSLMDGMANDKSGDAAGAMTYLSVDATQEFKVLTNAMSAEFGRTTGGVISVISKSGTNNFHGAFYEYLRNTVLNANEFFTNRSGNDRAPVIINQFGGAVGGPIVRNKIFFHANAELFRERRSRVQLIHSPNAQERGGDFSGTLNSSGKLIGIYDPFSTIVNPDGSSTRPQFANNIIPSSRLSQSGKWFMDQYPAANQPGLPFTRAQNLFQSGTVPVDKHTWGIKVDFVLPHSSNLAVRYTKDVIDNWEVSTFMRGSGAPLLDDGRTKVIIPRHSGSLVYTLALKPTLLLDIKSGYNRDFDQGFGPATALGGFDMTVLGLPASLRDGIPVAKNGETGLVPRFNVGDLYNMGGGNPHGRAANTWSNGAAVTYITGDHTLKFGYEARIYQTNPFDTQQPSFTFNRGFTQGPNPTVASSTAGWGLASFLLGTPASGSARIWDTFATSQPYHAAYVQEDWKTSQKLTLNLGLRWEYESPITDRYDRLSMFDPDIPSPLQVPGMSLRGGMAYPGTDGRPRGIARQSYDHFGPRLGFAYAATSKLVVRGGYGVTYVPVKGNGFQANGYTADTPLVSSLDGGRTPFHTMADPFPDGLVQPAGNSLGAAFGIGTNVRGHLFETEPGYAQQWNFTLQYEPFQNWLVEGAYIGNKGTHLLYNGSYELNQLHPSFLSMGDALNKQVPNPFYGIIPTGALSGKTVPQRQLLLPFPQFTRVQADSATDGYSQYHAFALKIEKRFAKGVSFLTAYTWSKLIDGAAGRTGQSRPGANVNGSIVDIYDLSREKSKGIQDMPHRLVVTGMWELPFGQGMTGVAQHLLGGWQINSIMTVESGRALALSAPNGSSGTTANRPNVVPGVDAKLDNPTLERWFNTDAFARPGTFEFGNSSRVLPNVSSDGMFNLDLSLFKDFRITEKAKVQFRAEAFNLTNTPTFDGPNTNVASASFGTVSAIAFLPPPREIQLALRLEF